MKKTFLLLVSIASLWFTSCDKPKSFPCAIEIDMAEGFKTDSLSIYCYEVDYGRSREVYVGKVDGLKLTLSENCNAKESRVAYLKIGTDTMPYYFVIEPGRVNITLDNERVVIRGAGSDKSLFDFKQKIKSLEMQRQSNEKTYLSIAADSTLTRDKECEMFRKDSVMLDSIHRLIVAEINKGGAVSRLVKEQYSNLLSKDDWKDVK